jgi:RND family efflux transporter MFP subunit
LVVALTASVAGCGRKPPAEAATLPPAPVTTAKAVARDVPVYLDEIGRCVPSESVVVMPRVTGSVASVVVKDGAVLAVGDPLFTIDPRPYEARRAEARARHTATLAAVTQVKAARASAAAHVGAVQSKRDQARAQVTVAKAMADAAQGEATAAEADAARAAADRDRMESMGSSGAVSQQDLARMRTDLSSAEAKLAAARRRVQAAQAQALEATAALASSEQEILEAEAQLAEAEARIASADAEVLQAAAIVATAQLDVDFCNVTALIAGRAGRRLVDVGSVVTANATPLLSIQRTDPIYVEFSVTEKDLSAVQRQMAARTLKAEVRLPDASEPREGDITFLDNAVEPGTGTARVRVTVANADARFWPGRFARVRLLLDTLPGAVLVPAAAPSVSALGTAVYVVKDGKDPKTGAPIRVAEMRPVKVGQRQGDLVVLESGVAAGEPVIVERSFLVFPGAQVLEVQPPAPGPGGAPGAGPGGPPATAPAPAPAQDPASKPEGAAR